MKTDIVFENLKVGQKLYSLIHGELEIYDLKKQSEICPIWCRGMDADGDECEYSFAKDGKYIVSNNLPSLFLTNPFEKLNQERVIEVYNNRNWIKLVCIRINENGFAVCWDNATTLEEAKHAGKAYSWSTWRELNESNESQPEQYDTITISGVEYLLTPKTK